VVTSKEQNMATYEYEVQGNYGYGDGWECLTTEATLPEAKVQRRCYDENEPGVPHRVKRVRADA
jgi:hypothetical protein